MTRARVRLLGPCFKTGRVGGRPNATDPKCRVSGAKPGPWPRAVDEHCEQSTPVGRAVRAGRPSLRAGTVDPRSHGAAGRTPESFNVRQPGKNASYSRALRPPCNRSWRYARGKCTSRGTPGKGGPVLGIRTPPSAKPSAS